MYRYLAISDRYDDDGSTNAKVPSSILHRLVSFDTNLRRAEQNVDHCQYQLALDHVGRRSTTAEATPYRAGKSTTNPAPMLPVLTHYQVTDSREIKPILRPSAPPRTGTRIISVDNVLQYASEIPSAQRRVTPNARPANHNRTPSGRHPLDPKLSGKGIPLSGAHIPARSSKTSEKLVLLPETSEEADENSFEDEDDSAPPKDDELRKRRIPGRGGKSEAERLPKSQRIADPQLARVTAYCTAQSYKLRTTAAFVREQHGAKTKLYDDCLYCVYQLPLLGGSDGYRVRSSPVVKQPGGRSVLDEQIEANERRQYREGWGEESEEYSVRGNSSPYHASPPPEPSVMEGERHEAETNRMREIADAWAEERNAGRRESASDESAFSFPSPAHSAGINPNAHTVAELFIFSYGVAVLWNFTQNQERDLLADLTFSSSSAMPNMGRPHHFSQKAAALAPPSALPLMTRPLDESDFETEEFHFQYDDQADKPRIYNDMITLRTSDHFIKLAMSHAVGQSTKLSYFEERMQKTMESAQYVPRQLALEGSLGMDRKEIVSLVGKLFEGRVDVNLCESHTASPVVTFTDLDTSKQHARYSLLFLGLGTHTPSSIRRRPRVPRNQATCSGPQRAMSCLLGPRGNSFG